MQNGKKIKIMLLFLCSSLFIWLIEPFTNQYHILISFLIGFEFDLLSKFSNNIYVHICSLEKKKVDR